MNMIVADGVSFQYEYPDEPPLKVLEHIDLTIEQGSFVALLGHNGCGKSTIAKHFNAMLLPTVEEYNLISNPEKFRDIAVFMGKNVDGLSVMEAAHLAVDAMRELAEDVGIPSGLAQMGVKEEDFDLMATNALKDGNAFSNPRKGTKQEIIDMFRKAM